MGELRNCPVCGKVFVKLLKNLCPDCIDKEEREFEEVRLYLKDNPGASIGEISEFTGVDEDKILKWMREDRIDVCVGKGGVLTCKRCGSDIIAGNLCSKCAQVLAAEIKSATHSVPVRDTEPDKPKEPKGRGMFTAQKLRDDN